MKVQVNDMFIMTTNILARLSLIVDEKNAIVDLARQVETESGKVDTVVKFVPELSVEFTEDEIKEIEDSVAQRAQQILTEYANAAKIDLSKVENAQLKSDETEGNEKDLQ